jgi:hypothetical protein
LSKPFIADSCERGRKEKHKTAKQTADQPDIKQNSNDDGGDHPLKTEKILEVHVCLLNEIEL